MHDGRRTCDSLLANLDVDAVAWPRRFCRHAQFAITMEVYTEATRAELKKLEASPHDLMRCFAAMRTAS